MQIVINIPDEQIKKSLEESKCIHEDEGEKGFVNIVMLYTNAQLEFVDVERKTDFYSCEYNILPEGHGRLVDLDALQKEVSSWGMNDYEPSDFIDEINNADTIIEADKKYEVEIITRGNCMMCGKELTEGLFFCKECEEKGESEVKE